MGKVSPSQQTVRVQPSKNKHLYNSFTMLVQRQRHRADIVQMLYKWGFFAQACLFNVGPPSATPAQH